MVCLTRHDADGASEIYRSSGHLPVNDPATLLSYLFTPFRLNRRGGHRTLSGRDRYDMASAIHALNDALTSAVLAQVAESAPSAGATGASVEVTGMPSTTSSEAAQPLGAAPVGGGGGSGGSTMIFWLLPIMVIFMILMTSQAGKKDRKRREELMKSIKRQDKVITGGGIIGTVIEMTDDEVVLRVEEGKIRVSKASIGQVLREAKPSTVAEVKADGKTVNA